MKLILSFCLVFGASLAFADSFTVVKDGQTYVCNPSNAPGSEYPGCAEASMAKMGYIASDCSKVQNDAQDICAGHSINKIGYVASDCLKLIEGGRCAITSLDKMGYITTDCTKVSNSRQDKCAAASLLKVGYVTSDCLKL